MRGEYNCYVHEGKDYYGDPCYFVGHYDERNNQYFWPISAEAARKSGCSGAISRTLAGFGGSYAYTSRKSALNRARLLYGPSEESGTHG